MKKWLKYMMLTSAILLVILLTIGMYWYQTLKPSNHFDRTAIPVLATPNVSTSAVKAAITQETAEHEQGTETEAKAHTDLQEAVGEREDEEKSGFNVLLLGVDARADEASRTDAIMLIHIEPNTNEMNLVSIPRDTRVELPGIGYTKINHAHIVGEQRGGNEAGTKAAMQAISNLCQCDINYYAKMNFAGFIELIDLLGGIEIELEKAVYLTYSHTTLPAGRNHLEGETALQFAQERKSLEGGDEDRRANQALIVKTIIRKMLEPSQLVRMKELYAVIKSKVLDTNLQDQDIASLALLAMHMDGDKLQYASVPGRDGRALDPLENMELYYWIPDLDSWHDITKQYLIRQ